MRNLMLLSVIVLLVCPAVFAEDKVIVVESKGRGASRAEAIRQGLIEAVGKAKGVEVSSGDFSFGFDSAAAGTELEDAKTKVQFEAVSVGVEGTAFKTDIAGLVKTYEVLDEQQIDEETYEVTLKVEVFDYEALDKTKRVRVALMPVETKQASYSFGTFKPSAEYVSGQLSQKLAVALTETNKFAVLDREYIEEFLHEKDILISDDASLEEKAKLGKVLGADYMLVGTISDARLVIKQKVSSVIGRVIREYEADFVFDYRLLVGPSRAIKIADSVVIQLDETADIKKLVKEWEPEDLDYKEVADSLMSMVAGEVVMNIIDRLYPVRVASIDEHGNVVINQGGRRIAKGLLLDVFMEGKEIIDIDTKESLGKMEILVATIKVERAAPMISYCTIVSGDGKKVLEGLVCRVKKVDLKKPVRPKGDIKRLEGGGVKLPFDE